jgi:chromosome segregation ATPase
MLRAADRPGHSKWRAMASGIVERSRSARSYALGGVGVAGAIAVVIGLRALVDAHAALKERQGILESRLDELSQKSHELGSRLGERDPTGIPERVESLESAVVQIGEEIHATEGRLRTLAESVANVAVSRSARSAPSTSNAAIVEAEDRLIKEARESDREVQGAITGISRVLRELRAESDKQAARIEALEERLDDAAFGARRRVRRAAPRSVLYTDS